MEFFDTHAHLGDEQFSDTLGEVIARAGEAGVSRVMCVGITLSSSRKALEIAGRFPGVYAAVGIHPNSCHEAEAGDWDHIVKLAREEKAVALGETGLDLYWDFAPLDLQQDYFDRHLRLSQETGLPFVVHMRDCADEVTAMLREARGRGPLRGIMHSFTGDSKMAAECLDMGLYVSFAGMVTFKKSDDLRAVAAEIPSERLLIETDSPYLSPHPLRGKKPNEPARVVHTAECLARVRGVSLETLADQTTGNARRLLTDD